MGQSSDENKPVRVLNRIPKSWQEIKNKEHDQLSNLLCYAPDDLLALSFTCPHCNGEFKPDWTKKRPPMGTVKSPEGYLRRLSAEVTCSCGRKFHIKTPCETERGRFLFFGDEARRQSARWHEVIVYSFVGTNPKNVHRNRETVRSIKRRLLPGEEAEDWRFHMKEIWKAEARARNDKYSRITDQAMHEAAASLFSMLRDTSRDINVFCGVGIFGCEDDKKKRKKTVKHVEKEFFQTCFAAILQQSCNARLQPVFTFESDHEKETMPGWSRDAFYGLQSSLLYPFITKGIYVPPPEFRVASGDHPFLELADFVAFVVARVIDHRIRRKKCDLDDANLGHVVYMSYEKNGDLRCGGGESFPFKERYGF